MFHQCSSFDDHHHHDDILVQHQDVYLSISKSVTFQKTNCITSLARRTVIYVCKQNVPGVGTLVGVTVGGRVGRRVGDAVGGGGIVGLGVMTGMMVGGAGAGVTTTSTRQPQTLDIESAAS